jgi:DNA-binding NtrC family response regulator
MATGLRRKKQPKARPDSLILLLLDSHSRFLQQLLDSQGYTTAYANAADRALALCVSNPVQAIVIDQCLLEDVDGWSVAQSVKMVKPSLPVILLCHGPAPTKTTLPTDVDFLVSDTDIQQLTAVLKQSVKANRPRSAEH